MLQKKKKKFKDLSIGIKLNLFFLFLVVIPFVCLGILASMTVGNMKMDQIKKSSEQYLKQCAQGMEYTLTELDNIVLSNLWNEELLRTLHRDSSYMTTPDEKNMIRSILQNIANTRTDIKAITLTTMQGEQITYPVGTSMAAFQKQAAVFRNELLEKKDSYYYHGHMKWHGGDRKTNSIMGLRRIRDFNNLEELGSISIFLNEETINKQYANLKVTANSFFIVKDHYGNIVSTDRVTDSLESMEDKIQNGISVFDGRKYYINSIFSDELQWEIFILTPYYEILFDIRRIIMVIIFVIMIILGILFLLMFYFSRSITSPIQNLQMQMTEVKKGKFSVIAEVESQDEIGNLTQTFNDMTRQIKELIEKDYQSTILIKEAQYKFLRAQINPHFLYNTLDTISWMAAMGKTKDVSRMAVSLGRIMRWSISNEESVTTLKEETDVLKDYLSIQQLRFGETLHSVIDIEEDAGDLEVPRMILQPLVENALIHGLEGKEGEKHLVVDGYIKDKILIIHVEDDGCGMSLETARKLMSGELKSKGNHGVGYTNVHQRINIAYGDPYGLQLESQESKGTVITIKIPARKGVSR